MWPISRECHCFVNGYPKITATGSVEVLDTIEHTHTAELQPTETSYEFEEKCSPNCRNQKSYSRHGFKSTVNDKGRWSRFCR